MVAPAAILFALFLITPVILTLILSVTNVRLISPNPPSFQGVDNFVRAFTADPTFLASLRNTLIFAVVIVPLQGGLGLGLALLINQKIRGINAFRTIYFVPVVTSMVVLSMLWKFIYQADGLLNSLISTVTFGALSGTDWLNNTSTALPAIIAMSAWAGVGFHMVIWLSGLQTIPESLYEAADLDGCSPWQKFAFVTWPGLRPTFVFVLVTITIAAFSLFIQPLVMTNGGPLNATVTIVLHAVNTGFSKQQTGYAAAISLIFFLLVLVVSLIQRRLTKED
ncbi:carbohydrate ABC transporter permease [Actinotalea sp. K2]|uniref:carbohydrate ABC transporter permease n=1 Tax=Actinotalea sp. K2 TaxID=2939438 RepID=UPI0020179258|nr:sugar ABC transporter permease [Actinotalea sp. K2]MCL3861053.1 sugar ABC transporter permease [Actinotalea sp. K2]